LQVDDIQSERVFIDDPVDAAVRCLPDPAPGIRSRPAIAHAREKVDDHLLKEMRSAAHDPVEKRPSQLVGDFGVGSFDTVVGGRSGRKLAKWDVFQEGLGTIARS
jgi:hypothetical protein